MPRPWRFAPHDRGVVARITREMRCSPLLAQVLAARGLQSGDEAKAFLSAELNQLHEPDLLPGVPDAADRIAADLGTMVPALVLLFAAEGALLAPLTGRLREAFGAGCRVLGCSSAGSFAFGGYCDDRVVAVAFPAAAFRAEAIWLRDLRQHMALDWIRTLRRLAPASAG